MLRGLAIALPAVLLMSCTDPTDLADALAQKAKLPHRFVLGTLAAMRLVGIMAEQWQTIGMARRARGRGLERQPLQRLRATLGQSFGLLVQAIRRASRLAVTMEARGFGGAARTWARPSASAAWTPGCCWAGCCIAGAAVAAALAAGTWNMVFLAAAVAPVIARRGYRCEIDAIPAGIAGVNKSCVIFSWDDSSDC